MLHTKSFNDDQIAINRWLCHDLKLSWKVARRFNRSDPERAIDVCLDALGLRIGALDIAYAARGRIEDMERKPSHYFWHPNLERAYSSFESKAICHETLKAFLLSSQERLDVSSS